MKHLTPMRLKEEIEKEFKGECPPQINGEIRDERPPFRMDFYYDGGSTPQFGN